MAQDNSLYIVDVYVSNEGEPESALELCVLRFGDLNKRPHVYLHTYIQPTCKSQLIRWNEAAKQGLPRELFTNNRWPTLDELIEADYLRDKYVVCFCANYPQFQRLLATSNTRYSILKIWQDVFSGNEEVASITEPTKMLEYIGLPTKDTSNTRYTPLMKRTHALLAISLFLFSCKSNSLRPGFAEGDGDGIYRAFWPLPSVPQPWYDSKAKDLNEISPEALCAYFSDRLPDYIEWVNVCVYHNEWVFGRDRRGEIRLKQRDAMIQFIFNNVFNLPTKIMVLAFYLLYEERIDYARNIALHQGPISSLPQSIKEDFLSFIIRHLDDFLTAAQKTMIIGALVKQLLQTRREEAVQHYDYEALKKQRDENGLIFEEETIPNNKNIVCYKEIRNQERVLYRCFVMQGSADERNACIDFINLKMREIYTSLQDPMSPFWFSEELRLWICYITGFSWDELTNRNRPQDRETLVATRHSICSIMKEQIHPYVQLFLQQLSSMVEDINNTSEKENKRSLFAFMGVTHEVIVEKTTENMSFLERVKRIL